MKLDEINKIIIIFFSILFAKLKINIYLCSVKRKNNSLNLIGRVRTINQWRTEDIRQVLIFSPESMRIKAFFYFCLNDYRNFLCSMMERRY